MNSWSSPPIGNDGMGTNAREYLCQMWSEFRTGREWRHLLVKWLSALGE